MSDEELAGRFQAIDKRFDKMEKRFDEAIQFAAQEFEAVRSQIRCIDRRLGFICDVAGAVLKHNDAMLGEMAEIRRRQVDQQRQINDLDRRVQRLEGSAPTINLTLRPFGF